MICERTCVTKSRAEVQLFSGVFILKFIIQVATLICWIECKENGVNMWFDFNHCAIVLECKHVQVIITTTMSPLRVIIITYIQCLWLLCRVNIALHFVNGDDKLWLKIVSLLVGCLVLGSSEYRLIVIVMCNYKLFIYDTGI